MPIRAHLKIELNKSDINITNTMTQRETKIEMNNQNDKTDTDEMNMPDEFTDMIRAMLAGMNSQTGSHSPSVLAAAIIEGLNLRDVYPRLFAERFYESDKHYISKLAMMRAKLTGRMNQVTMFGYKFSMHPDEIRFLTDNNMKAYQQVVDDLSERS